jgi:predicted GTPase
MEPVRVLIMGAAGRDFHNFNMVYRDNPNFYVVAFTATQIPNIEGRRYPPQLAGNLYPNGIPIYPETDLPRLIAEFAVQQVVFAYSDVSHQYVMDKASQVLAAGPDFVLIGPDQTMLTSIRPVVAVTAVRTGSGKSQTTRRIAGILRSWGRRVAIIRHPMPYGNLAAQAIQEFRTLDDLATANCTIEEREEYEPHLVMGTTVFAGVDYERILRRAEEEHDVIVWDGGNNDVPFVQPNVHIVVADPLRPGHELTYYPGAVNLRRADVVVINKIESAIPADVATVRANIEHVNPQAIIIEAASPLHLTDGSILRGKRVLVIEDGPTLTHGEMTYGAGVIAARKYGAAELVDPRPYATGTIQQTYERYPHIGPLLPAMGYSYEQIRELEATINASPAEVVVIATPIDLGRLVDLHVPTVRVSYSLQEIGSPTLDDILADAGLAAERV